MSTLHSYHQVPEDASTISLEEPWHVEHWGRKFGVAEADLRSAMSAIGAKADEVKRYLNRPIKSPRWGSGGHGIDRNIHS